MNWNRYKASIASLYNKRLTNYLRDVRSSRHRYQLQIKKTQQYTIEVVSPFVRPFGVSINPSGEIFVSDITASKVIRFTRNWEFLGWLGQSSGQTSTSDGWKSLRCRGSSGSQKGQLCRPHNVEFSEHEQLYVTDSGNACIEIFSKDGQPQGRIPNDDIDPDTPPILLPTSAYFDNFGFLLLTDYRGSAIHKFDKRGKFVGWLGDDGTGKQGYKYFGRSRESDGKSGFCRPHSVRMASNGSMLVTDTWNHRIVKLDGGGEFIGWIGCKQDGQLTEGWENYATPQPSLKAGGLNAPCAIEFHEDNSFIVCEFGASRISRFSEEGYFLGWFGGKAEGGVTEGWEYEGLSREGKGCGVFRKPYDITLSANSIFVTDTENGRMQVVTINKWQP